MAITGQMRFTAFWSSPYITVLLYHYQFFAGCQVRGRESASAKAMADKRGRKGKRGIRCILAMQGHLGPVGAGLVSARFDVAIRCYEAGRRKACPYFRTYALASKHRPTWEFSLTRVFG